MGDKYIIEIEENSCCDKCGKVIWVSWLMEGYPAERKRKERSQ